MSYEPPAPVPWLEDWRRAGVDPQSQREYVARELARIAEAGAQVLTQVLTLPLDIQRILAMSLLDKDNPIPDHRYYVRLVPGAAPQAIDPQGRPVKPPDLGNVQVVKLGTKGGQLHNSSTVPDAITSLYCGPAQQAASNRGQDIYVYKKIGRDPVELTREQAVIVLGRYGYGIPATRYWHRNDEKRRWDSWCIEEIPPAVADDLLREKRERDRAAPKRDGKAA